MPLSAMLRVFVGIAKSVLSVATCGVALRVLAALVKSVLSIAQFAALSRFAETSGLRETWVYPMARSLSQWMGLSEGYLEILILALLSFWLMCLISALCRCLSAALDKGPRST